MDDKVLEVVAVFGSAQLGLSRVINLQHHRIAQVPTTLSIKKKVLKRNPLAQDKD